MSLEIVNRSILNNRLVNISIELKSELDYYLDIDHEDHYDSADAFEDYLSSLEDKPTKEMQRILIEVGYAVEVDITKVIVSRGKKYWFKKDGKHYDCVSSWESWINE
jgi:hypothetical protein